MKAREQLKKVSERQLRIMNIAFEFLNVKVYLKSRNRKKDTQEKNGKEENSSIGLTLTHSNIKCKMMRLS